VEKDETRDLLWGRQRKKKSVKGERGSQRENRGIKNRGKYVPFIGKKPAFHRLVGPRTTEEKEKTPR